MSTELKSGLARIKEIGPIEDISTPMIPPSTHTHTYRYMSLVSNGHICYTTRNGDTFNFASITLIFRKQSQNNI